MIENDLAQIRQAIKDAESLIARWRDEQRALKEQGIYPAIPAEQWREETYLYLHFRAADADNVRRTTHLDTKNRVYVGRDPNAVEAARATVARTKRFLALGERINHTDRMITSLIQEITHAKRKAQALTDDLKIINT